MLRLHTLGRAELRAPDGSLLKAVAGQPKLLALTSYLAVSRPAGTARRDTLLPIFWPDLDETSARHALSQALSVMRGALGPSVLDGKYRSTVKLDPAHLWCDATAFRRAVTEGRLSEALDLYGGPLLEGFHLRQAPSFERWLEDERRELTRLASGSAVEMAREARAEESWAEARRWAERAIGVDPYDERAWRELILGLDGSGNGAGAQVAYHRLVRLFADDLGIEPSHETSELAASIGSRSGAQTVAARVGTSSSVAVPGERTASKPSDPSTSGTRHGVWAVAIAAAAVVGAVTIGVAGIGRISSSGPAAGVRSLAVLPIVDVSPTNREEYFADALTAELGHEISRIRELAVTSHGSSLLYRDAPRSTRKIAGELSVDAVLEGQVLRRGSDVRLMLQLVDGANDRRLWSGAYEGTVGGLLAIQRRVAREVAVAIEAEWPVGADQEVPVPAVDPQAYEAYLRGLYHLERYNTQEADVAVSYLERAIEIEPGFPPAHAALARACAWAWNEASTPIEVRRCESAAEEALRLEPDRAEAHAALGFVFLRKLLFGWDRDWNWSAAEQAFRDAIDLNPNSAAAYEDYAELLRIMRRQAEARAALKQARRLNPMSPGVTLRVGIQALAERRFDDALAVWDDILEADPTYTTAHYAKGATLIPMRLPEQVLAEADEVARQLGEDHIWVLDLRAHGHALAGDLGRALEFARRPDGSPDRLTLASVYAVLGDSARALDELEGSLREDPTEIPNVTASERFDDVRDHPRFVAVRAAVGLR